MNKHNLKSFKQITMKILLSSTIALIALFTVTGAFNIHHTKFNAHWVVDPCISSQTLTGKIAGLGSGDITISVTGQFACINPGSQDPPAWRDLSKEIHATITKNGNYNLSETFDLCKKKWTTLIQNLNISVYEGTTATGTPVLTYNNVPACQ
jgi:hypothetical protein